jgi:hypothetical protein
VTYQTQTFATTQFKINVFTAQNSSGRKLRSLYAQYISTGLLPPHTINWFKVFTKLFLKDAPLFTTSLSSILLVKTAAFLLHYLALVSFANQKTAPTLYSFFFPLTSSFFTLQLSRTHPFHNNRNRNSVKYQSQKTRNTVSIIQNNTLNIPGFVPLSNLWRLKPMALAD